MPNTVLIAGASGLVGAACVDRLLDRRVERGRRASTPARDLPATSRSVTFRWICAMPDELPVRVSQDLSEVTDVVDEEEFEKPVFIAGWTEQGNAERHHATLC